jgi:hypothetical protein
MIPLLIWWLLWLAATLGAVALGGKDARRAVLIAPAAFPPACRA